MNKLQAKYPLLVDGYDNNGMTPTMLAKGNNLHEIADWISNKLRRFEGKREFSYIFLNNSSCSNMLITFFLL